MLKQPASQKYILIVLILLLVGSVLLSYFIPQSFSTPNAEFAQWQKAHHTWLPTLNFFGLHHIFSTNWFAAILFFFLLSLIAPTHKQFKNAYLHSFENPTEASWTDPALFHHLNLEETAIAEVMQTNGYIELNKNQTNSRRYQKHIWGHWGIFLLYLGISISVAASLSVTVGAKRGYTQLIEGEIHQPDAPWINEERGILAGSFILPEAMRLDEVVPVFSKHGGLKNIESKVRFISSQNEATKGAVALNDSLAYQGIHVYQETGFGKAFYLWLTNEHIEGIGILINMKSPLAPKKPSTGAFNFPHIPYTINAKYYADVYKKNLAADNPLLILQLVDKENIIGQLSLRKEGSGQLGPYNAKLIKAAYWTNFTFVSAPGFHFIIFGFFTFCLGGFLYNFTIPREFYCEKTEDGCRLTWKCARFGRHYLYEYKTIISRLEAAAKPKLSFP